MLAASGETVAEKAESGLKKKPVRYLPNPALSMKTAPQRSRKRYSIALTLLKDLPKANRLYNNSPKHLHRG